MAIEIVDFPIKNGGSFHSKMLVHQRVTVIFIIPNRGLLVSRNGMLHHWSRRKHTIPISIASHFIPLGYDKIWPDMVLRKVARMNHDSQSDATFRCKLVDPSNIYGS